MGPRHYTAENRGPVTIVGSTIDLLQWGRGITPRKTRVEHPHLQVLHIRLQWGRGITPRKTAADFRRRTGLLLVASMGPRHYTAENLTGAGRAGIADRFASMGPRHYTAENRLIHARTRGPPKPLQWGRGITPRKTSHPATIRRAAPGSFNGAAALHRGKRCRRYLFNGNRHELQWGRGITPRKTRQLDAEARTRAGRFNGAAALHRGKHEDAEMTTITMTSASMGPRHYTAENALDRQSLPRQITASMGPRHYTAENPRAGVGTSVARTSLQWGRGITPRKTDVGADLLQRGLPASMGPRHYTAENTLIVRQAGKRHVPASMGPRHYTAENDVQQWGADQVGVLLQWGRGITPRKTADYYGD